MDVVSFGLVLEEISLSRTSALARAGVFTLLGGLLDAECFASREAAPLC